MHYFLLPMIPLTILGAIFFKRGWVAYGFAVVLTLNKAVFTVVSPIYFFTALALAVVVHITRRYCHQAAEVPSFKKLALLSAVGVVLYSLISNFGVWILGGCTPGSEPIYAMTLEGLFQCYKAGLPYAGLHLVKAVPTTIVLVWAVGWLKGKFFNPTAARALSYTE